MDLKPRCSTINPARVGMSGETNNYARDRSERSPDGMKWNPGNVAVEIETVVDVNANEIVLCG